MYNIPVLENPSCPQATLASLVSQKSSQTVPHMLLLHISTRPSDDVDPPTSRRAPVSHAWPAKVWSKKWNINIIDIHKGTFMHYIRWSMNYFRSMSRLIWHRSKGRTLYMVGIILLDDWQVTPASSLWAQLWTPKPLSGQSTSWSSFPTQFTLSNQICPLPWPKKARDWATAPLREKERERQGQLQAMCQWYIVTGSYQMWGIPTVDTPPQHHYCPKNHHIQCPTHYYDRLQHVLAYH